MFSSEAKIFRHVSNSAELVRMCLVCQHFDFNGTDWISDNLHKISSRYLRTMGKEFIFQFSRRSRDAPQECLRGRLICSWCELNRLTIHP